MRIAVVHADYNVLNSLDHIVGHITHKYSNLICPVLGFSEVLRMQNTDDGLSEFINHTFDYSLLLKKFNDDLGMAATPAPSSEDSAVCASVMCEEALKLALEDIGEDFKALCASVSFENGDPAADQEKIVNEVETVAVILRHLIKNGFEATPECQGGVYLQTSIMKPTDELSKTLCLEPRAYYVIEVISESPAVEESVLQKAIYPLFTTKDETAHKGLGLWQSFKLARSLDGTVTLTNYDEGKTCASVYLPVISQQEQGGD